MEYIGTVVRILKLGIDLGVMDTLWPRSRKYPTKFFSKLLDDAANDSMDPTLLDELCAIVYGGDDPLSLDRRALRKIANYKLLTAAFYTTCVFE